jgi:VCBS repeat-containing protein
MRQTPILLQALPRLAVAAVASCGGDELTVPSGLPAKVEKAIGDAQSAPAGTAVGVAPAVKVLGRAGEAVAGVLVTFQVTGGGGTVTPTEVRTDASGVAAVTSWTLGPEPGPNELTATVTGPAVGGNPAVFAATGVVGNANKLVFSVQPSNTLVNARMTPAVKVQIQDAAGNPVTSATDAITVALRNAPTSGSLAGTTSVRAIAGTATFSDLRVAQSGTGFALTAQAPGLTTATSAGFNIVNAGSATTINEISPNTSVVGQPYVVTFSVAAIPTTSGTPTGTVTVSDGTGATCTGGAPSGSCALTSTTAGTKSVVATYSGDGNLAGSESPAAPHDVGAAATTGSISSAPATSFFGQPITVVFSVSVDPPGAGTPIGNVTITYENAGTCTAPVAAGRCSFTPTAVGTRNLQAVFAPGTPDFGPDESSNVSHTVKRATTATAVSSNKNPANAGESVTLTAVVTVTNGSGKPTRSVTFRDGNTTLATVPLGANGSASTTQSFAAGQHNVTAQYSGDTNFEGSTSPVLMQQVNAVNASPTARGDNFSTDEDTPLNQTAPGVLANDTDPNQDPLTAGNASNPTHGSLTLKPDGSFTYTPASNFNGSDAFTYTASDGKSNSSSTPVTIRVNPVNDAPTFTKGADQTSSAGMPTQTVTSWATAISPGPSDESGQSVSFVVTIPDDQKSAFVEPPAVSGPGTLTYQPAAALPAPVSATVTVTAKDNGGVADGGQDTSPAQQFTITINP